MICVQNTIILARVGIEFQLEEFLRMYVVINLLGLCV